MNKPFYVFAETYKFVRLFPLTQNELPEGMPSTLKFVDDSFNESFQSEREDETQESYESNPVASATFSGVTKSPALDYTPPEYISLLFTNAGILTPSGVSDELIKLYF